jgi:hypothetical protein
LKKPAPVSLCERSSKKPGGQKGVKVWICYDSHCRLKVKLFAAANVWMSRARAKRGRGFAEAPRGFVAGARVKHIDATGFRIGGETQCLDVAAIFGAGEGIRTLDPNLGKVEVMGFPGTTWVLSGFLRIIKLLDISMNNTFPKFDEDFP